MATLLERLEHYSLRTIVGLLVSAFVLICRACGVDVHQIAPQLTDATVNLCNAVTTFVPLCYTFWQSIHVVKAHSELTGAFKATAVPALFAPLTQAPTAAPSGASASIPVAAASPSSLPQDHGARSPLLAAADCSSLSVGHSPAGGSPTGGKEAAVVASPSTQH